MEQLGELGLRLVAKQRVFAVEEGRVDLGPVGFPENFARQRHRVAFFGRDVRFLTGGEQAQAPEEFGAPLGVPARLDHQGAQRAQLVRLVTVILLQRIEDLGGPDAALTHDAKQVVVFLGMMGPVDKVLKVVEHRCEEARIDRRALLDLVGHVVDGGGQAPEVAVVFADDAQCLHGRVPG